MSPFVVLHAALSGVGLVTPTLEEVVVAGIVVLRAPRRAGRPSGSSGMRLRTPYSLLRSTLLKPNRLTAPSYARINARAMDAPGVRGRRNVIGAAGRKVRSRGMGRAAERQGGQLSHAGRRAAYGGLAGPDPLAGSRVASSGGAEGRSLVAGLWGPLRAGASGVGSVASTPADANVGRPVLASRPPCGTYSAFKTRDQRPETRDQRPGTRE